MFSSSVRRALFTIPTSASPIAATLKTSAPKIASSQNCLQRRYSSSKPSSPANGSKGVLDRQPTPSQPSRGGRRKSKDAGDEFAVRGRDKTVQHLPSVPDTTYLKLQDVTAADFFSLHRPISVTDVWPQAVSDEMFGSIFTKPTRDMKTGAVIGTLSSTIEGLNAAVQDQIPFENLQSGYFQESQHPSETTHLDQPLTFSIPFPQHVFSTKFKPFHPPPPPMPMDDTQSLTAGFEAVEELQKPAQPKKYHALITVEESQDENGKVQYTSYASDFVPAHEAPAPPTFLERMKIRQKRYEDSMDQRWKDNRMWAISVKRQRKLKMKKHKYKKLMRKTRNIRRRLERT